MGYDMDKPIKRAMQAKNEADRLIAEDLLAEFKSVDIHDDDLDIDLGNLIAVAARELEMLVTDWTTATSEEHNYILWDVASDVCTMLRAVPLYFDSLGRVSQADFRVLEIAVRCEPIVKNLCAPYALWRDS